MASTCILHTKHTSGCLLGGEQLHCLEPCETLMACHCCWGLDSCCAPAVAVQTLCLTTAVALQQAVAPVLLPFVQRTAKLPHQHRLSHPHQCYHCPELSLSLRAAWMSRSVWLSVWLCVHQQPRHVSCCQERLPALMAVLGRPKKPDRLSMMRNLDCSGCIYCSNEPA